MTQDSVMTPAEMVAIIAVQHASAEPIVPAGWTKPAGYTLIGPRRNKLVLPVDEHGNVSADRVRLWLDGIAYGTAKIQQAILRKSRDSDRMRQSCAYHSLNDCLPG